MLLRLRTWLVLSSTAALMAPKAPNAHIAFITTSVPSRFGATSPSPRPSWSTVAEHLSQRLPGFDSRITAEVIDASSAGAGSVEADIAVVLGVSSCHDTEAVDVESITSSCANLISFDCSEEILRLQRVGAFRRCDEGALQALRTQLIPWSDLARGKRLSDQADLLMSRYSSEDLLYALFFILHGESIIELDLVKHTVNPTWEKGPLRNTQEFATMCTKCGDKIGAALTDPETKVV